MDNNKSSKFGSRGSDVRLQIAQPYSLQAEQAIIGAIIDQPAETFVLVGDYLLADHFYDPFCKAVYGKACELLSANQSVDPVILSARLEAIVELTQSDIMNLLEEIFSSYPSVTNVKGWADVVIDKSVERGISEAGGAMTQAAHAQNVDRTSKLASAHKILSDLEKTLSKSSIVSLEEMLILTLGEVEQASKLGGKISGVPSGFNELDDLLLGFSPGDLVVLGARPSMGKTAIALSIAKYCTSVVDKKDRKAVLMFSMEMGAKQIGMRWLAVRYEIPIRNLRSGQVSPKEHAVMKQALEEASEYPFSLEETGGLTVDQLCATARKAHSLSPLGMIVIDYLQLIQDSGRSNASKAERVGDISRALKQLARELGIPIIALSQLSRELEKRSDKRPIMSDLRESGAIEQDADIIMFVYRDEVYNPGTVDAGIAEVIIAKQRNGALGTIKLAYHGPTTSFRNLTAMSPAF